MPVVTPSVELVSATRVPVFFAGTQTDSSGKSKSWTVEELDEAATAYNEAVEQGLHDAPCLHGHRGKHAVGWLGKAYREGKTLFVDLKNVVKEFADGINNKLHPKRSISFYPPEHPNNPTPGRLNINHLAWLPAEGEINPAIKGLPDVSFADFDDCLEYLDVMTPMPFGAFGAISLLFQSMRDQLIESDDIETADERIPQALIDQIKQQSDAPFVTYRDLDNALAALDKETNALWEKVYGLMNTAPSPSEFADMDWKKMMADKKVTAVKGIAPMRLQELMDGAEPDDSEVGAIASALEVDVATLKKPKKTADMSEGRLQALELQVQGLIAENQQLKAEQERNRVTAFVEKLVADRKVYPADKQSKIELALSLPGQNPIEYSEGEGTVQMTPRERYLQDLAKGRELYSDRAMPTGPEHDPTSFTEPGLRSADFDLESVRLDAKIRAKAKEMGLNPQNTDDYTEAFNQLVTLGQVSGI